jgi:hypothetical protein
LPEASQAGLANSSIRKLALGVLLSVPPTAVPAPTDADVSRGKFWSPFGPVSASPASLAVTPRGLRSIPMPVLEKMLLPRMLLPVVPLPFTRMPLPPLLAITLPAPDTVPPTVVMLEPLRLTQTPMLASASVPLALVPM